MEGLPLPKVHAHCREAEGDGSTGDHVDEDDDDGGRKQAQDYDDEDIYHDYSNDNYNNNDDYGNDNYDTGGFKAPRSPRGDRSVL